MNFDHMDHDIDSNFIRGLTLAVCFGLVILSLVTALDRPQVSINAFTKECERVISDDPSHTCANLDSFRNNADFIYSNLSGVNR